MRLPIAPAQYSQSNEQQARYVLEQEDAQNHKRNADVDIARGRLILTAPNGSRWQVTVSNAGVLGTTAL